MKQREIEIMATITKPVEVIGATRYERENWHIPTKTPIVQTFVAITMRVVGSDELLVNYTRVGTAFSSVEIGDKFTVSGQFKEHRKDEHREFDVITHCKKGGFKGLSPEEAKERRRKKMLAKLMG
jgi:hypothetical protein